MLSKNQNLLYAQQLLQHFVKSFAVLYGEENVSHNVHNLLHLTDDVHNFGSIENFSAFHFENHMMFIKKLVRKGDQSLQQIVNRISERTSKCFKENKISNLPKLKTEHFRGPLIEVSSATKQFEKIHLKSFLLSLNEANNCCALDDGSIVVIKNIILQNNNCTKIIGQEFSVLENFYMSPCESSKLNIFLASRLSTKMQSWDVSKIIIYKCVRLNFKDKFVVFPLMHCTY